MLFAQLAAMLLTPITALADDPDGPCDYADPYSTPCPLDGAVWLLVILAVVAGAFYLHRRQKVNA